VRRDALIPWRASSSSSWAAQSLLFLSNWLIVELLLVIGDREVEVGVRACCLWAA